jgi:SAM-dependent methyltransferase
MNVFRIKWAHQSRWHQARYHLNCRRLIRNANLSFEDAIELVRKPKGFADYLYQRFANPSFMSDMVLMSLLAPNADAAQGPFRFLDLACGAGHASFLVSNWFPNVSVVAADHDFVSLYLAKRFLAPKAAFVCTDSEAPSPFPAAHFDAVHCLDAFHYLKAKRAVVAELIRVTKAHALWLFPHQHNALVENVTPGIPLSPDAYEKCFEAVAPLLFDEADLRRAAVSGHGATVELARRPADLSEAQSLAIVGGSGAIRQEPEPFSMLTARHRINLGINPIYDGVWTGKNLKLRLRWPNDVLRKECRDAESILPPTCEISAKDLNDLINGHGPIDARLTRELLCRFVVVPLPHRYRRRDLLSTLNHVH